MNRIMFVLAIGCAQVAMSATWTDQSTGITWTYTAHGTKATLGEWTTDWHGDPIVQTAVSKTFSGNLVIPSSINGLTVDSICNEGFWGCTGISSITIPEGVTDIGKRAFYGCTGLVNVILPSTVESLDGSGLEKCV